MIPPLGTQQAPKTHTGSADAGSYGLPAWAHVIGVPIAVFSDCGRLVFANDAMTALLGELAIDPNAADEIAEALFARLWHDDTEDAQVLEDVFAGRTTSASLLSTVDCHGGETQRLWVTATSAATGDSKGRRWVVFEARDVTAELQARAELRFQVEVNRVLTRQSLLFFDCCKHILAAACRDLKWDGAVLWVPTAGGVIHRSYVHTEESSGNIEHHLRTSAFLAEAAERAFAGHRTIGTNDSTPPPGCSAPRAFLTVPIGGESEVLAVAQFVARRPPHDTPTARALMRTAGTQLAGRVLRERAEQRAQAADLERRATAETLASIMSCVPIFILTTDREGTITFINRTDPPGQEASVVGTNWLDYLEPERHDEHRARLARVLEGAHAVYETKTVGEDGTVKELRCHIGPLRRGEAIAGSVIVAQDITDDNRREIEFQSAQRLAAVGTLAAGIAHEINTPIQFVSDSVHFLQEAAGDAFAAIEALSRVLNTLVAHGAGAPSLDEQVEAAQETLEDCDIEYLREHVPPAFARCIDGLDRVAKIVRSMKEFSHPASETAEPADLNRAIESTLIIARNEYKYVADLETDFGDLPPVLCHISDVNQVILNLVVNAAHAIADVVEGTNDRGTIRVRTWQEDRWAHIEVADTGGGIPRAISDRVFDPFFTTKEVGKGTGQGLALAWRVIHERHGGKIWFESREGEGTTFHIRLPIDGPAESHRGAAA